MTGDWGLTPEDRGLEPEDCEPTAIANRRLAADWETNYELRTNYNNPR